MAPKTRVSWLLGGGFLLMIFLMVVVQLGSIRVIDGLASLTDKMYRHPLTVSNAVLEAEAWTISIHRRMREMVLAQTKNDFERAVEQAAAEERNVLHRLDIVAQRFLGEKSKIEDTRRAFSEWRNTRLRIIDLKRAGRVNEAAVLLDGKCAEHMARLRARYSDLIAFARTKALSFLSDSKTAHQRSRTGLNVLMAFVFLIAVLAAFIIVVRVHAGDKRLRASEERFRSILESSVSAMVVVVDDDGKVIHWNPAAERTFGYDREEVLGRPMITIIPERYREAHKTGLRRALEAKDHTSLGKRLSGHGLKKTDLNSQ